MDIITENAGNEINIYNLLKQQQISSLSEEDEEDQYNNLRLHEDRNLIKKSDNEYIKNSVLQNNYNSSNSTTPAISPDKKHKKAKDSQFLFNDQQIFGKLDNEEELKNDEILLNKKIQREIEDYSMTINNMYAEIIRNKNVLNVLLTMTSQLNINKNNARSMSW